MGNVLGNAVGNAAENNEEKAIGNAVRNAVGHDGIAFIVLSIISKTCRTWFHKTVCSLWTLLEHACTISPLETRFPFTC